MVRTITAAAVPSPEEDVKIVSPMSTFVLNKLTVM